MGYCRFEVGRVCSLISEIQITITVIRITGYYVLS